MNTNIPSFVAGIIIVFSVLIGTQSDTNKSADNNRFVAEKKQEQIEEKNSNAWQNRIADIASLLKPPPVISFSPVTPTKLVLAEDIPAPPLKAKSAISISSDGKIIYQNNPRLKLPVASITKLITALVVLDELKNDEIINVSEKAIKTYGEMGKLIADERLTRDSLLYIMLIDSSNDAAVALANAVELKGKNFVLLMNQKAQELQLADSTFNDPSGLDPKNISTAYDLAILMNKCLMTPAIEKILSIEKMDIYSVDNKTAHHLKNTNKLLNNGTFIGGKTGYTEEAGECLVLAVRSDIQNRYFISVVLGTEIGMRFIEMEKLVKWTKKVYGWQ